ncbi:MAG: transposase [Verrucomicrobiales bacterium]|nr:transposase [Verrucomicrobiales bacterium]
MTADRNRQARVSPWISAPTTRRRRPPVESIRLRLAPLDPRPQEILERFGELYAVEREAREGQLGAAERLALRQSRSVPVMAALKERLDSEPVTLSVTLFTVRFYRNRLTDHEIDSIRSPGRRARSPPWARRSTASPPREIRAPGKPCAPTAPADSPTAIARGLGSNERAGPSSILIREADGGAGSRATRRGLRALPGPGG